MRKIQVLLIAIFSSSSIHLMAQKIEHLEKTQTLFENKKWEKALIGYKSFLKTNKTKGEFYYNIATCYYHLNKNKKAVHYFKKSISTGYKYGASIKMIALSYANSKHIDSALYWTKKGLNTPKSISYHDVLSNSNFLPVRHSNSFIKLYPQDSTYPRNTKWQVDIAFLKERLESKHYDVFNKTNKASWDHSFKNLSENIKNLSDAQILLSLMALVSSIGDGHTFIRPPISGDYKLHHYPFKLYIFSEGVFVIETTNNYKTFLGAKLTHINDVPIEDIILKFKKIISVDNEIGYLQRLDFSLLFSEILFGLGITDHPKTTHFQFEKGIANLPIKAQITAEDFNPGNFTQKISDTMNPLPLYQKNSHQFFWSQRMDEIDAMYLKININLSTPSNDIKAFYNTTFNTIDTFNIKRLIIDLRDCPGGNSFNNQTLIKKIIANKTIDIKNGVFVIIGRTTFSAAMNLATDLETWVNPIFIGEPTGSKPNFIGETNFVTLPNTGLQVSISDAYWQKSISWDHRKWIAPDIYISPTFENYRKGIDPVIAYILDYYKEN